MPRLAYRTQIIILISALTIHSHRDSIVHSLLLDHLAGFDASRRYSRALLITVCCYEPAFSKRKDQERLQER